MCGWWHERHVACFSFGGLTWAATLPWQPKQLLFDTPGESLRRDGRVLRLRKIGQQALLTFKGPATYREGVKSRDEAELEVDGATMLSILDGLGYRPLLEYRKTRETWQLDGALVALDTLDFGRFVEIEGAEAEVRRVAGQLGLEMARAVEKGYPALMRAHLAGEDA